MSPSGMIGVTALALLEGALVALPRAGALEQLGRLRSPAWAAVLPGSIVVGTFGVRALPPMALALVVLAAAATPFLSAAAVLGVVRCPRPAMLPVALTLAVLATLIRGWTGELSASMLTGLGCLTVGVGLVRLIPRRLMLIAVLSMCAVDVTLLALGAGQPAAALMTHASNQLPGPVFARATAGPITTDYLDLVLAGVLGGFVAGHTVQRRAAVLVTALATGYGMLLPVAGTLPATVPIAVTFTMLYARGRRRQAAQAAVRPAVKPAGTWSVRLVGVANGHWQSWGAHGDD
jgi:hypothetical protein